MDDQSIEEALARLKNAISINEELKRSLRREFVRKSRIWTRRAFLSAAAAVLLIAGLFGLTGRGVTKVEAAELEVRNQLSFVDIGSGTPLGAAEYKGTVYVPVFEKGLYAYESGGARKLTDREIREVRVDPTGKRLVWTGEGGSLGLYDLASGQWTQLLKGDGETAYEQPSWKDEHTIVYVKKVYGLSDERGVEVKSSELFEQAISGGIAPHKLGDGSSPSVVKGRALVYEKETDSGPQVVYRELDAKDERVIDQGRFPSVSPDGAYVAYVKTGKDRRTLEPNAFVEETVDNVWVSDVDGRTKRMLTGNSPYKYIDEQEWLKGLQPSDVPQTLTFSGMFSYYNPTWSSDSASVYTAKNRNAEGGKMSLMRIDLAAKPLKTVETVEAFEQATIRRDDDFARSLLKNAPPYITVSNPHKVSYTIVGSGKEGDRPFVDADEYWTYTANPHYAISRVRFYLSQVEHGYVIDEQKDRGGGLAVMETPEGNLQLERDGGAAETLLRPEDVPQSITQGGQYRIASIAWLERSKSLLLSVQMLGDSASVKLVRYDAEKKTFEPLTEVDKVGNSTNVGVEDIIVSPDERWAALDIFSDNEPAGRSHVYTFDLQKKAGALLDDKLQQQEAMSVHTFYWEGSRLHFTVKAGEQTFHYRWNAERDVVERP